MGRKPNSLILEFFERGQKLEDASNRYQHTCKSCGEKFPKGRIDSLTAHLLKKCPAISPTDRQRALKQLSETPNQHGSYNQLAVSIRQEQAAATTGSGTAGEDALGASQNLSPLETLAEVSRQRLDNGQYVPATGNSKKRKRTAGRAGAGQPDFLPDDFFLKTDASIIGLGNETSESNLQQEWVKTLRSALQVDEDEQTRALLRQGIDQFTAEQRLQNGAAPTAAPTAQMVPHQLALAASAANEMLPNTGTSLDGDGGISNVRSAPKVPRTRTRHPPSFSVSVNNAIDPQLQDDDSQMQGLPIQTQEDAEQTPPMQHRASVASPDVPHSAYLNDFSISGDQPKTKSRGRFSDSRRKEVQEVRKQGACVRCRMLKKPCSGGTPCTTCRNVEAARLWKTPCIRARIADEFDLYGTDLHKVIAFQEISQIKELVNFEKSPRSIEATHFDEAEVAPASFASVRGSSHTIYQATLPYENTQNRPNLDVELLDQDSDDISGKLFNYIKRTERMFFEQESSSVMRPTLLLALDLVGEKLDPLLSRALELWTMTHILVDKSVYWRITSTAETGADGATESADRREPSLTSFQLLSNQLRACTEKHAAQLAKVLMNDLERRLLQRQQASGQHFETFLSAIILLNCVERMCWYFSTWVFRLQNAADGHEDPLGETWPLPKDPQDFVNKGERIAGVVAMLLRMRGIPPVIHTGEDGILYPGDRLDKKDAGGARADGGGEGADQAVLVAAWLDSVKLHEDALKDARAAQRWDDKDCRCWDLRYVSQLLLTEPVPREEEK